MYSVSIIWESMSSNSSKCLFPWIYRTLFLKISFPWIYRTLFLKMSFSMNLQNVIPQNVFFHESTERYSSKYLFPWIYRTLFLKMFFSMNLQNVIPQNVFSMNLQNVTHLKMIQYHSKMHGILFTLLSYN